MTSYCVVAFGNVAALVKGFKVEELPGMNRLAGMATIQHVKCDLQDLLCIAEALCHNPGAVAASYIDSNIRPRWLRATVNVLRVVVKDQNRFLTGVDRKSTRLNSSHQIISYAVFC